MRAIVYARQSLDRTGEELGVLRQLEDARKLAEARGWTITAEQVDNDVSAAGKRVRPGFEAVLAAIEAGTADVVIAWDMSRVTRNRPDQVRLLEIGERHGTLLAFVRGSDLDLSTPAGQLTADIMASVARHEIKQKGDRQRSAVMQAARAGKRVGGRRPFGYLADGRTINAPEADALRRAYGAVLAGVPLGRIARDLNAAGLHTPQRTRDGKPSRWTSQTLRPTLLNPRYCALRAHGKGAAREILGPAEWTAIVEESTWRAAVAVITDPSRSTPSRGGLGLLTGLGECGVCGATVHAGGSTIKGVRNYRCSASTGHVARRADPVDEFVGRVVVERMSRPDARDLLHDHERPDVDALRQEMRELGARLDELAGLHVDGEITTAQLRAGTERARTRLAAVEGTLAHAGRVNVLGPMVDDAGAAWRDMDTDRRREVIRVLMRVVVHPPGRGTRTFRPESVGIEWRTHTA